MWVPVSSTGKVSYRRIRGLGSNPAYTKNQLVSWLDDKEQSSWSGRHRFNLYHFYQKIWLVFNWLVKAQIQWHDPIIFNDSYIDLINLQAVSRSLRTWDAFPGSLKIWPKAKTYVIWTKIERLILFSEEHMDEKKLALTIIPYV